MNTAAFTVVKSREYGWQRGKSEGKSAATAAAAAAQQITTSRRQSEPNSRLGSSARSPSLGLTDRPTDSASSVTMLTYSHNTG